MRKVFVIILLLHSFLLAQDVQFHKLDAWANDFTNTLTPEQLSYLNNDLRTFSDSTSNQLVLLVISTLDGYPIEEYAYETATQNKIGSKNNNNGVLFLVVKDDRKFRIEVGYGLEGTLPDALSSSILRNEVKPYFQRGNYFEGIRAGVDAIKSATAGEYKATERKGRKNGGKGIPGIFLIILFIIISILFKGRRRRGGPFIFYGGGLGGFGGGHRGGGFGGFGGGGGGGFSGGGGSFGGGGSSGSW